jgi:hypothetical protein
MPAFVRAQFSIRADRFGPESIMPNGRRRARLSGITFDTGNSELTVFIVERRIRRETPRRWRSVWVTQMPKPVEYLRQCRRTSHHGYGDRRCRFPAHRFRATDCGPAGQLAWRRSLEATSAGGSRDQRTTCSYLARPTPQPISAPAPAPYHDPTIAAPPAPIGKQPSLHEAAPQAAPAPAPTMRPNQTGCRSIHFLLSGGDC